MAKLSKLPSTEEKLKTAIEKNTLFLPNPTESQILEDNEIKPAIKLIETLFEKAEKKKLQKQDIVEFLQIEISKKVTGLHVILAVTGFSFEKLKRIITVCRLRKFDNLNKIMNASDWIDEKYEKEWAYNKILKLVRENEKFAEGLSNFFCDGSNSKQLKEFLPQFEYEKLKLLELVNSKHGSLQSLIRYKWLGSISGRITLNPEKTIKKILKKKKIIFTSGDISHVERRMDAIIPNNKNPEILIESTKETTTASGQGDKAKTEKLVRSQIKKHYPKCLFVGFVDGVGWLVRPDLKILAEVHDEIFTNQESELIRFEHFLERNLSKECYAEK